MIKIRAVAATGLLTLTVLVSAAGAAQAAPGDVGWAAPAAEAGDVGWVASAPTPGDVGWVAPAAVASDVGW